MPSLSVGWSSVVDLRYLTSYCLFFSPATIAIYLTPHFQAASLSTSSSPSTLNLNFVTRLPNSSLYPPSLTYILHPPLSTSHRPLSVHHEAGQFVIVRRRPEAIFVGVFDSQISLVAHISSLALLVFNHAHLALWSFSLRTVEAGSCPRLFFNFLFFNFILRNVNEYFRRKKIFSSSLASVFNHDRLFVYMFEFM